MWGPITTEQVRGRMSADEIAALETGGETDSINNKLPECISEVVALVRGKVAACKRNTLGIPGTIPGECRWAAISLIRHALVASIPNFPGGEDAAREREYSSALELLDQVAKCELSIVAPEGGIIPTFDDLEYGYDDALDFAM